MEQDSRVNHPPVSWRIKIVDFLVLLGATGIGSYNFIVSILPEGGDGYGGFIVGGIALSVAIMAIPSVLIYLALRAFVPGFSEMFHRFSLLGLFLLDVVVAACAIDVQGNSLHNMSGGLFVVALIGLNMAVFSYYLSPYMWVADALNFLLNHRPGRKVL